ncbi:alpha-(1,3)-fucosyltransferase 9-like isoform X2 [Denticeps clupeoides]|nr:alpha-(1,3)-fucosyltransferase 9-like isoform X2 [Denticeps clupeoides]
MTLSNLLRGSLIAVVLVTVLLVVFFAYSSSPFDLLPCSATRMEPQENFTCPDVCSGNISTFHLRTEEQNGPVVPKTPAGTKEPDTLLLMWFWPFGVAFEFPSCSELYNIQGCQFTADRNLYGKADGVLIHHRDIGGDLSNMPQTPRPVHQKWIWWNHESPTYSTNLPALNNLFNLTANYRRDADIFLPYGTLEEYNENGTFEIPKKDKLVCWIVSHWNPNHQRRHYYEELKNHINIDIYGRPFEKYVTDSDFPNLISSCKFYLSFENSVHVDYLSGKVYDPLQFGTVPVVLGPPRDNYEEHAPGDSFIHVEDFPTPKDLANRLLLLDKNETMYREYFNWRKAYKVKQHSFTLRTVCYACDHVRRFKGYKVFKNFNKWFWG